MVYVESSAVHQAALEKGRQTLLELAFGCVKKLVSPYEHQTKNRTYSSAELLLPENWTGVRIKISRTPNSEIPPFWPKTTNEVLECIFSFTKEQSSRGVNFEGECHFIDGDKQRINKGLPSETITALINDLLIPLTLPKVASPKI